MCEDNGEFGTSVEPKYSMDEKSEGRFGIRRVKLLRVVKDVFRNNRWEKKLEGKVVGESRKIV